MNQTTQPRIPITIKLALIGAIALVVGVYLGIVLGWANGSQYVAAVPQEDPALTPVLTPIMIGAPEAADVAAAQAPTPPQPTVPTADPVDVAVRVETTVTSGSSGRQVTARAKGPDTAQVSTIVNGEGSASAQIGLDRTVVVDATTGGGGKAEAIAVGADNTNAHAVADGQGIAPLGIGGGSFPPMSSSGVAPIPQVAPSVAGAGVVINESLVNVREGPGVFYAIVGQVTAGQQLQVIGRNDLNDWWQVCCVNGRSGWVASQYALPSGVVGLTPGASVPVLAAPQPQIPIAPTPAPTVAAPTPIPTPDFDFAFVAQEQFLEGVQPRLFVFFEDTLPNRGAGGYSVRIKKDGVDIPVSAISFEGIPGLTWPWTHDDRQRSYNLKIEFQNLSAAGSWQITPVDGAGRVVGQPVFFQLRNGDPKQEMYAHFVRKVAGK